MSYKRSCIEQHLIMVLTGTEQEIQEGWTRLKNLDEQINCQDIKDIFQNSDSLFQRIFRTKSEQKNVDEIPNLLKWFSKHLKENSTIYTLQYSDDIAVFLKNTTFQTIDQITNVLEVLTDSRAFLHPFVGHTELCNVVITILASIEKVKHEEFKLKEYYDNCEKVGKFFEKLTSIPHTGRTEYLDLCLSYLYETISSDNKLPCGFVLAEILKLPNEQKIEESVKYIISQTQFDGKLVRVLKILWDWLHGVRTLNQKENLSKPKGISIWIFKFIIRLEEQQKFSVLSEMVRTVINRTMRQLIVPAIRQKVGDTYLCILRIGTLRYQLDIKLLIRITKDIISSPHIMIASSDRSFVRIIYNEVSGMVKDFEDDPIFMENWSCIEDTIGMMNDTEEKAPMSAIERPYKLYTSSNRKHDNCVDSSMNQESPSVKKEKTSTDHDLKKHTFQQSTAYADILTSNCKKVGLSNLGNSCYMNSVLQALLMTKRFRQGVLTYEFLNENDQIVLRRLQELFALLWFIKKKMALLPSDFLNVSRPTYFLPGQQQDSSEFLCHLLDVLHEHEKSANTNEESSSGVKRWTTQENVNDAPVLQEQEKNTRSSFDFTEGDDLMGMQNLSNSHSNSNDSGIQSVGGEDSNFHTSLVHKVFGGQSEIIYECTQCNNTSHNKDQFRDLQLCFPKEIEDDTEVSVQELIEYYFKPERLMEKNQYDCDTCKQLCDATRFVKVLQTPAHLILTLKHFYYDLESGLRRKLRHKVVYNDTIELPVHDDSTSDKFESYQLYAAVVHSGSSLDYGHYFTYARDEKQWYKFNDNHVSFVKLDDLKNLRPPDTPYILFYEKSNSTGRKDEESKSELTCLSDHLQKLVAKHEMSVGRDTRSETLSRRDLQSASSSKLHNKPKKEDSPPRTCRESMNNHHFPYLK